MRVAAQAAVIVLFLAGCGNADALLEARAQVVARTCLSMVARHLDPGDEAVEVLADRLSFDHLLSLFENSDGPRRSTVLVMRSICRARMSTVGDRP